MNYLQSKLLSLLLEVDKICKKYNITYYLAAGGGLGAVRNGGFLPWDDDIDIYITHNEFEKFKAVINDEIASNRNFVCNEWTKDYCNPIARYIDRESTMMMKSQLAIGECCGEFIEFFIFDLMPEDKKKAWEHQKLMKVYTELLTPYMIMNPDLNVGNKDFDYELFMKYYNRAKEEDFESVLREIENQLESCPDEEGGYYCMRWGTRTIIYPREYMDTPGEIEFEGIKLPVLSNIEKVMRISYGDDWMYVPEDDNQIRHNINQDLHTSYETYTSIYMPLIDKEAYFEANREKKDIRVHCIKQLTDYRREFAMAKLELAEHSIKTRHYDVPAMKEMLNDSRLDQLGKELAGFVDIQSNPLVKAQGLLVDVSDEYLEIAIQYLIDRGQYVKASKILKCRMNQATSLSQGLLKCQDLINLARELSVAIYDDKDKTIVKSILDRNRDKASISIDYQFAKLWYMRVNASGADDYNAMIRAISDLGDKRTLTGEILGMKGYALYQIGDLEQSRATYAKACDMTRNAFVWRDANNCFNDINMYAEMELKYNE